MTAALMTAPRFPGGRLATALVHGPVLDRTGNVQTTSITNLDVHDLARSSRTYGCAAFYVVTPIGAQREMAGAIVGYWEGEVGRRKNADRTEAMGRVAIVSAIDDAIAAETAVAGVRPKLVATSAKPQGAVSYASLRAELDAGAHVLLLFGTGHGLTDETVQGCDAVLAPLVGPADPDGTRWNHLSVRSAAAIILDRLRGS
jgi:tRNA (guanine37-N1)-methyltransferase